jgi:hypothetical protein
MEVTLLKTREAFLDWRTQFCYSLYDAEPMQYPCIAVSYEKQSSTGRYTP